MYVKCFSQELCLIWINTALVFISIKIVPHKFHPLKAGNLVHIHKRITCLPQLQSHKSILLIPFGSIVKTHLSRIKKVSKHFSRQSNHLGNTDNYRTVPFCNNTGRNYFWLMTIRQHDNNTWLCCPRLLSMSKCWGRNVKCCHESVLGPTLAQDVCCHNTLQPPYLFLH